ncbi:uncharacterized protein TNIN_470471 [Trichonephila inaurata madagascariensis]|uniref:Granulins domain-containing protein n=1 Tax=Trichonephila inaurata madagascariensis TaxID=2747483 RepID=A0A8X7BZR4_9ARAC|nr:uncharacterized protein TNIN_470471 [Trichonephila inaurata madagascariensis]
MKIFLLLTVVLPCIVIADIRCPGGKICPSSQKCCEVNNEYECCDPEVEIPQRKEKVYAGMGMLAIERTSSPSHQNISEGPLDVVHPEIHAAIMVAALILAHVVEKDAAYQDINAAKMVAVLCQPHVAQEYVAFRDTVAATAGAARIPRDVDFLLLPVSILRWFSPQHLPVF